MVRGRFGGVHSASKGLATWREAVRHEAALVHDGAAFEGPVAVDMLFAMHRPANRKGQPIKRPDLDKLCRAVFDALTDAGVWKDDSQAVILRAQKRYEGDEYALPRPGLSITVRPAL